jgi:hypothetical protein
MNDVVGLVRVPERPGDVRAAALRLICLLTGVILGITAPAGLVDLFAGVRFLLERVPYLGAVIIDHGSASY